MNSTIFNFAQSFLIDPASVKGAKTVDVSSVDLYFKSKPNATGNKSGIKNPGVYVFICEMTPTDVPDIRPFVNGSHLTEARAEYVEIKATTDATLATKFKFDTPIKVKTGINYAVVGIFDGNEAFTLWTSTIGENLVGTNTPSTGASGKYVGNYFGSLTISRQPSVTNPSVTLPLDVIPTWKPSLTTDLKFKVNLARYAIDGVPVGHSSIQSNLSPTQITFTSPLSERDQITYTTDGVTFKVSPTPYEFITFDRKTSVVSDNVFGGEYVYQNTVFYPGGSGTNGVQQGVTVSTVKGSNIITASSTYPNGAAFNWSGVYGSLTGNEYIVVVSLNGATGRKTDIRKIVTQISNTVIQVDSACGFTNSSAYFIKSPVGRVDFIDVVKTFDVKADTMLGRRAKVFKDMLVLSDSNANSTVRFVNNTINSISIATGGTNYTNSDYVRITGFESSVDVAAGYEARANIVANTSTGAIEYLYLSNVGAGFSNVANISYTITRTTGSTVGTSGTFTVTTGTVLRSEYDGRGTLDDATWGLGGRFDDCNVINLEFYDLAPRTLIQTESSSTYNMTHSIPYYARFSDSAYSGVAYRMASNDSIFTTEVTNLSNTSIINKNTPVLASKSNEYAIIQDGVGSPTGVHSGAGYTNIVTASNNDFVGVSIKDFSTTFSRYDINSDYKNENTDYGNAASKHITKKITFAQDKKAEDLLVYLSAYRPLNTDIKVFARLHNSNDPEAFDDKDWTLLDLVNPAATKYSSSTNSNDYFEMTFGLPDVPNANSAANTAFPNNTVLVYSGTINVENTSTMNVIGTGTTFSSNITSNVQVNDLVKIYDPIFPTKYVVAVVEEVPSDTRIVLSNPVGVNGPTGTGLNMALMGRVGNSSLAPYGYPLQAFNNKNNGNVARYYSRSMVEYDTFDTMQLKVVFLADTGLVSTTTSNLLPTSIPRIDDIRAVGVSA
jgi:hypothetical protein